MTTTRFDGSDLASYPAGADLTGKELMLVTLGSNGKVTLSGAGENSIGVLQECATLDHFATVAKGGEVKALANGDIVIGARVQAGAGGYLITATGGKTLGIATSAGHSGTVVSFEWDKGV